MSGHFGKGEWIHALYVAIALLDVGLCKKNAIFVQLHPLHPVISTQYL